MRTYFTSIVQVDFGAAKFSDDRWIVEPIFEGSEARAKGFLSDVKLRQLIRMGGGVPGTGLSIRRMVERRVALILAAHHTF